MGSMGGGMGAGGAGGPASMNDMMDKMDPMMMEQVCFVTFSEHCLTPNAKIRKRNQIC